MGLWKNDRVGLATIEAKLFSMSMREKKGRGVTITGCTLPLAGVEAPAQSTSKAQV
jgi:hypothetical protein